MADEGLCVRGDLPLAWGYRRLPVDPQAHLAAYGARLIWAEVMDGGQGAVWDRQAAWGPKELVEDRIFPVLGRWYADVRAKWMRWNGGERDECVRREGDVLVVGSPSASYGYLYVTAVLEKAK